MRNKIQEIYLKWTNLGFFFFNVENLSRKMITECYSQCSCRNDQSVCDNSLGYCKNKGKAEHGIVTKGEMSPKRKLAASLSMCLLHIFQYFFLSLKCNVQFYI